MTARPEGLTYLCYWIYRDSRGQWRWVYYAPNGEEVAVSSERYAAKASCLNAIKVLKASAGLVMCGRPRSCKS